MRGVSHEVRVKSLIARETRKRIFWALTSQVGGGVACCEAIANSECFPGLVWDREPIFPLERIASLVEKD